MDLRGSHKGMGRRPGRGGSQRSAFPGLNPSTAQRLRPRESRGALVLHSGRSNGWPGLGGAPCRSPGPHSAPQQHLPQNSHPSGAVLRCLPLPTQHCTGRLVQSGPLPAGPLWPPVLPSSSHFALWGLHAGSWNPPGALPRDWPALLPSQAPAPTHLPLTGGPTLLSPWTECPSPCQSLIPCVMVFAGEASGK